MKLFKLMFILGLPMMVLTSCGSDDDDGGSSGRIDTETDPGCLTVEQRENITTVLNRAAELRTISGTAKGDWRNDDGRVQSSQEFDGSYTITQTNANTWEVREEFCEGGDDCSFNATHTASFENGCFNWDGERASIDDETSNERMDFSITKSGIEFDYDWRLPESGTIRFETETEVAGQDLSWVFTSSSTDDTGSTTGDDGTTTGN